LEEAVSLQRTSRYLRAYPAGRRRGEGEAVLGRRLTKERGNTMKFVRVLVDRKVALIGEFETSRHKKENDQSTRFSQERRTFEAMRIKMHDVGRKRRGRYAPIKGKVKPPYAIQDPFNIRLSREGKGVLVWKSSRRGQSPVHG